MPTPDPPPATSTDTPGATFAYSSAQACATLIMVSEPRLSSTVRSEAALRWQDAAPSAPSASAPAAMQTMGQEGRHVR